jgi:hypothetical protein
MRYQSLAKENLMRIRALAALIPLITGLAVNTSQAAVWDNKNNWSSSWEERYVNWVRAEWGTNALTRSTLSNGESNPFKGMRADCADTVYTMRMVFAYMNKLPFAIKDPSGGSGILSNSMTRFDGQSGPAKARAFLNLIYNVGSTKSLPNDTYPVALNRNSIRPGILLLTSKANHHSWTLQNMLSIGVPHLVFNSTIGASSGSGLQERTSWPNPAWVFEGDHTPEGNAGFRAFRPISYLGRAVWDVPGYSEEQYRVSLGNWISTATGKLATKRESDQGKMERLMKSACEGFKGRVPAVNDGVNARAGRCMDFATYDNYSTPSRDERLFDDLVALRNAFRQALSTNGGSKMDTKTLRRLKKIFPAATSSARSEASSMRASPVTKDSYCVVEYRRGVSMDLAEVKRRMFLGTLSNNPNDDIKARWGESRSSAGSCQAWDVWTPRLGN